MEFYLADNPPLAFAPEYLSLFMDRGRAFNIRKLELTFHFIKNCLCLSCPAQVIAPIHEGGQIPCIFLESCPYLGNEGGLAADLRKNLDAPLVYLEEAAPFYPHGARNLWHWTTESLPKLLALEDSGYTGPYIVPHTCKVVEESLAMHGIAKNRLYYNDVSYRVERLLLPPRLSGFTLADNMLLSGFLRERILAASGELPGTKRCYVRRVGARRIVNEEDLYPLLAEFDFEIMTPEELPLKEQYRYMSNAGCSLMAHGANSTLILAQPAQSAAVECFSNRYVSYNNLHAVRLLKLRYHALVEDLDASCAPNPAQSTDEYFAAGPKADIIVDPLHLRILLENALGGRWRR